MVQYTGRGNSPASAPGAGPAWSPPGGRWAPPPGGVAPGAAPCSVPGAGEPPQPVPRVLARLAHAEVDVGLLAGQEQEVVVGEPAALVEHGPKLGQAQRAGVLRVAVAVELGEV